MEIGSLIRFDAPQWLLLLPCLAALTWWVARNSLANLSRGRAAVALGLRLFLVTALIVALARPHLNQASDALAVYFVVDISHSIPTDRLRESVKRLRAIEMAKPEEDLLGLIYFGADAACETPPLDMPLSFHRQSVVDRGGTDIAGALDLAASTFPAHARKRIVLVTDGNQNRQDADAAIERLRAQGIQLDVLPIQYTHEREILLEKAILPDQSHPDLPVPMRVLVRSTHATEAILTIRKEGVTLRRKRVGLRKGRNSFSLPIPLHDLKRRGGLQAFEVRVEPTALNADHHGDNNTTYAFTRIAGPPTILYVDGNLGAGDGYTPRLHEALVRGLRLVRDGTGTDGAGVSLDLRDAANIPDGADLAGYDCIVLDNVAAEYLGASRMERMRALINGQGIGLVMIGGEHAFGMGNYRDTPIEAALPVDMDLRGKKVIPNGALILVIDRSGSMAGTKMAHAKAAARAAVRALSPTDYIGVVAFDGQPSWLLPPTLARDRHAIRRRIASLGAGGGTDILAALQQAHEGIAPLKAALKHIVLLSDGQASHTQGFDKLMEVIGRDKVTVSTIGLGERQGQHFMMEIAQRGAGRFYYVTNPRRLPRILIKETRIVKRGLLFEETFTPAITDPNDVFLEARSGGGLPPLHGYVATTAKQAAETPLVSTNENQDPILAHWRYGLGRAVAYTSDAKNRWGRDWVGWSGYTDFWSNLVYRALRPGPANLRLRTRIEGRRGAIVVRALDERGQPLPFLDLKASITGPDARRQEVRLRKTGLNTYEGTFEADAPGRYEVAVVDRAPSASSGSVAYGGAANPRNVESTDLRSNPYMLHRLAGLGGGLVYDHDFDEARAFRREGLAPAIQYLASWPMLLFLTMLVFPVDICIRRVMINGEALRRWLRERHATWGTEPMERAAYASRLLQAKERSRQTQLGQTLPEARSQDSKAMPEPPHSPPRPSMPERARDAVPTAEANTPGAAMADTYTGRLLAAKKRLRGKDRRPPPGP